MSKQYDFKGEWEKTRERLTKFSKDALEVAKKGEKEFVKFSRLGKLHVDATAVSLKREQLYYLVGKEYVKANTPEKPTPAMTKLLDELKTVEGQQKALRTKLKNVK